MSRTLLPAMAVLTFAAMAAPSYAASAATDAPAQELPVQSEHDRLFAALKNARTEQEARAIEDAIWRMWMGQGPTKEIRDAVKAAMDARSSYDYAKALDILEGVTATAPDYAEGWNQKAFILFLMERQDASLESLDRALELEPRHFGALAGRGIILMQQGRVELGQKALRDAVAVYPFIRERRMIIPDPDNPLPPPGGDDI